MHTFWNSTESTQCLPHSNDEALVLQSVPAKLTRLGLSQIVNSLLALGTTKRCCNCCPKRCVRMFLNAHLVQFLACALCVDPAQAFDFIIAGELLRQPLENFLLAHSVSTVSCQNKQAD